MNVVQQPKYQSMSLSSASKIYRVYPRICCRSTYAHSMSGQSTLVLVVCLYTKAIYNPDTEEEKEVRAKDREKESRKEGNKDREDKDAREREMETET